MWEDKMTKAIFLLEKLDREGLGTEARIKRIV